MVCLSESTAWDETPSAWKTWIKRRLIALFSSALVGGTLHRECLAALGLPASHIFLGYDAVDNDYFAARSDEIRAESGAARERLRLPRDYFLASARFVPKKNLGRLLDAYARYRLRRGEGAWPLVLLGDGALRPALERQVRELGLDAAVTMPGFRQYGDLPAYYALAGAFVHASTVEPWGLVVNEAMSSGLPVLVSDRCGCVPELVADGENGFRFDPLDVETLAGLLAKVSAPDFARAAFGRRSREIVSAWGPERFSRGLGEAVDAALSHGPKRAGFTQAALLRLLTR
jgi:glycosyltransferase involved in cell wall biosynthesis